MKDFKWVIKPLLQVSLTIFPQPMQGCLKKPCPNFSICKKSSQGFSDELVKNNMLPLNQVDQISALQTVREIVTSE